MRNTCSAARAVVSIRISVITKDESRITIWQTASALWHAHGECSLPKLRRQSKEVTIRSTGEGRNTHSKCGCKDPNIDRPLKDDILAPLQMNIML